MRRKLFIPVVFFVMLSCSKEQDSQNRELNVSFKSAAMVTNSTGVEKVTFYPNPFQDLVAVYINGSNNNK